jgi:hypothetical protein
VVWRLLLAVLLAAQPLAPGVLSWPAGSCALDWYQGRAVVLACPGLDMLKLWPWPPAWPWFEDDGPNPPAPGQIAVR